jgi:hypothetical protein
VFACTKWDAPKDRADLRNHYFTTSMSIDHLTTLWACVSAAGVSVVLACTYWNMHAGSKPNQRTGQARLSESSHPPPEHCLTA